MTDGGDGRSGVFSKQLFYDKGTLRVVVFACLVIFLAVFLTGTANYVITRDAIVRTLQERDLIYIAESIDVSISGRIERARETALILARDPLLLEWVAGGETDERLSAYAQGRLHALSEQYDYSNAFLVSAVTNHYWAEGFRLLRTMERSDPEEKWFFDMLQCGKEIHYEMSYDARRKGTFLYVDALMGSTEHPLGVAGVGVNLHSIAHEFSKFKFAARSNLWLIDEQGIIYLSDDESMIGRPLREFVPVEVLAQIMGGGDSAAPRVFAYETQDDIMDLVAKKESSTGKMLVYQIPRAESIAVLQGIKGNTAIASLFALLVMVGSFYFVAYRIADPLKRALSLTQIMERRVEERTRQLAEKSQQVLDSIAYAKTLQEGVLVTEKEMRGWFADYFVLWRPRDMVGGDFYWAHATKRGGCFFALADCTGHGVPGALMTMTLGAVLSHAVENGDPEPDVLLAKVNRHMKEILHRNSAEKMRDDGLDIAICRLEGQTLTFAGAKLPLYVRRGGEVQMLRGDKMSVGYRTSREDFVFALQRWNVEAGDVFYLTTDGYLDQNGGEKNYAFGRKRFMEVLATLPDSDMEMQRAVLEEALQTYMRSQPQRDDIAVLGLRPWMGNEEKCDEEEETGRALI